MRFRPIQSEVANPLGRLFMLFDYPSFGLELRNFTL